MKILWISLFITLSSFAGNEGGNGGDPIRLGFLAEATKLIENKSVEIRQVLGENFITNLRPKLDVNNLILEDELLYDNKGSLASAVYEKGKIKLYTGSEYPDLAWSYLLKVNSIRPKMVLHEIIRLAGVNDDNYYFTNQILGNEELFLSQIVALPDSKYPLTSAQMIQKGIYYRPVYENVCEEEMEGYRVEATVALNCHPEKYYCEFNEVFNDTFIFSLNFKEKEGYQENLRELNEKRINAVLLCDYQRCPLGEEVAGTMNCSIRLGNRFQNPSYLNFLRTKQQQDQLQQQQLQQQQQQQQLIDLKPVQEQIEYQRNRSQYQVEEGKYK